MTKTPKDKELEELAPKEYNIPIADEIGIEETEIIKDIPAKQIMPHRYTAQHMLFLKELAKDLDTERAAAAVKLSKKQVYRLMTNPDFAQRVQRIHDLWFENIEMTSEQAGGNFVRVFKKIESDYDAKPTSGFAMALAKMTDTALRATGHMDKVGGASGANIVVNIGFSRDEADKQPIVEIEGQRET